MANPTTFPFVLRRPVGVGCGGLIGVERRWRARTAGLRTNALVAACATLFVRYGTVTDDHGRPIRGASYAVSVIGFLGAGVILREGGGIRGLNTSATLRCSAADRMIDGRVQLSPARTGDGRAPTGLRVLRDGEDITALRVGVGLDGHPARGPERLVARLSPEPGVRELRRHLDHSSLDMAREATAA
ncbi:MgtC/SapB family protein [Streptomyces sp. NPDC004752]